jgi:hypothetical protein
MTKALKRIYLGANSIFLLWLALSYFDIVMHNLTTQTYSNYNLIVIMFEKFNNILLGGIF